MPETADSKDGVSTKLSSKVLERTGPRHYRILLVPYPKFIFLYPTFLAVLIAAIWMTVTGRNSVGPDDLGAVTITWTFLAVLGVNVVVLAFDFPRTTSLTILE